MPDVGFVLLKDWTFTSASEENSTIIRELGVCEGHEWKILQIIVVGTSKAALEG